MSGRDGMMEDMGSRLISPAFIGRRAQLADLDAAYATVRRGEPGTVLLGGEAGVGKSRLAAEFAGQARAQGGRVLIGGCLELGAGGLPFAPFTAVIRDLVREDGAAAVIELAGGRAGEIARLLPDLGAAEPKPAEAAGSDADAYPGEGRGRLFEQMLTLLEQLSERGPVVLVIEDLHWADHSTRDLLSFLVSNQRVLPGVLIIGTFRSDELHRTHPLRSLLAELARLAWVRRTELPRLTRRETAGLLAAILGSEVEPERVDGVFARSEGNPLFAEELLCCDDELPESLRDLVLARVQRLPAATQDVLRIGSAAGDRAGHALLSAVSGLTGDGLEQALRPAVAANVLVAGSGGYAFRHALIREAMYEDLLPGERSRVHAAFAAAITADESLAAGRAALQLAYHWYTAHDLAQALASAWQAAAEANRVFAYAEQLSMLARASELWDQVPDAAQRTGTSHGRVLERAARAAHLLHENERARAFISAALREIDPAAEPGRAASLLELRGRLRPDDADAITDLREALSLAGGGEQENERAAVLASLAMRLGKARATTQARAAAEQALEVAERIDDLAAQASALSTLAMLGHSDGPGCSDADLDMLARARAAAARAGDHHLMLRTTISESHLLEGIGEHERAASAARDGIAEAARYGLARIEGTFMTINLAEPLHSLGRWDEATEVIERALELAAPPATRASLHQLAGLIAVARGELDAASRAAETAARLRTGFRYQAQHHLPIARLQIELLAAQRRYEQALEAARDPLRRYDLQASPRYAWPVMAAAARAAAAATAAPAAARGGGPAQAAAQLLAALAAEAAKLEAEGPVQRAHQLTFTAEVLRSGRPETPEGRPGLADQAAVWEQAAAAWEAVREPYPLAIALFRAAEAALASGGSREEASQKLRRAAEIATGLGARPLGETVAQLARRARIPVGDAGTAGSTATGGLTPRELEVLRLIAAGMSNARIASQLFISPKTASVHVSNIMSKLGAASRGEAAAAAHELRLLDGP
jgi:predicted ATPase/DNA-binding NarL/FixJ family response regulator